jgi:predicted dehydrogenase
MEAAGGRHDIVGEASRAGDSDAPYAELLQRNDIDSIYIPLPNHLHAPWIGRSLEAGKHVLCEKPLTLTPHETQAAFDAARAAGRTLMEAYMWPHHDRARQYVERAASGDLGTLLAHRGVFTFTLPDQSDHRLDERGAGALFDVGIYTIAPAMLIAGRDAVRVEASAVRNHAGVDTTMSGFVDFGAGFVASFLVSFTGPMERTLEIMGTRGSIRLPEAIPGPEDGGLIDVQRTDWPATIEQVPYCGSNPFVAMLDQFAAVCHGESEPRFGERESVRLAGILAGLHSASGAPGPR